MKEKIKQLNKTHNIKNSIIHVGSNNIPSGTPEVLIQKLSHMFQHINTIMPITKIYLSNILPKIKRQLYMTVFKKRQQFECQNIHPYHPIHIFLYTMYRGIQFCNKKIQI